jgi:hypothetical protein
MEPKPKSLTLRIVRLIAGVVVLLAGAAGCGSGNTPSSSSTTTSAAKQPATFAETVTLQPISGTVLVEVPGAGGSFERLASVRQVPVGTVVNATAGHVRLTVATPAPTHLRTGEFHGGIFAIEQPRADGGLAMLHLHDNLSRRTACRTTNGRQSQRILGLLRGTASGGFQTVGKFSAATVRGTEWGVRDRCDGTFTVVQEGEVVVVDFRTQKSVVLRTGQTFLAQAG